MPPVPLLPLAAGVGVLVSGRILAPRDRRSHTLLTLIVAAYWAWTAGWAWSLPALLAAALPWWPPRRSSDGRRHALARYWQRVALLAAAGMPPLRALEDALQPDDAYDVLRELVHGVTQGDRNAVERFVDQLPHPEAQAIAESVRAAWDHGLDPMAAHRRSLEMIRTLAQERRLAEAHRPLWTAGLPGLLLLNVVFLFLLPLGTAMMRDWTHL
ncbi:MAG: hypothetical protein K6V97_06625 [Actinomycetia bacterium]|nr:hypothetical protein [Actinomycetes bacterium]